MKKTFTKLLLVAAMLLAVISTRIFAQDTTPQLIGMAQYDGAFDHGTIFKIDTDGSDFSVLHSFNSADGAYPAGSVIQASNGLLYGMASNRGAYGIGNIFQMKPDGTGFKVLHDFDNATGRYTSGSLIQGSDGALYGMAYSGGFLGAGTIFKIELNGLGFKVLHHFNNVDGGLPNASLIQLPDGALYGIALGQSPRIFKINTDGSGYTMVYPLGNMVGFGTPVYGLDGALYGISRTGTIYKVNPDGSGFTALHSLSYYEGSNAQASVIQLPDGSLLTMTYEGGLYGHGTIFKMDSDGSSPVVLHHFNGSDGSHPVGNLTYYNNTLYGFTPQGGLHNTGVIFKYDLTSGVYEKMADLNDTTGGFPWRGHLLLINPPSAVETPTTAASTITFSNVLSTSMTVSFAPGNGSKHLAVMKAGSPPTFSPVDNMFYSGDLGNGEFVVYNSTESAFAATGLQPDTEYFITIFEYNQDSATTKYLTTGAPLASRRTRDVVDQFVGMASAEGASNAGTIFKFSPGDSATGKVLFNFRGFNGARPFGQLIQGDDEWLYGMTLTGAGPPENGGNVYGTIFKISPDGTNHTILHNFEKEEGAYPRGSLLQASNGSLYGVADNGGISDMGTIFKIETDGSGFTVLHRFMNGADGRGPHGTLIQATDGNLYGMAGAGGTHGFGLIFRISLDGNFTVVHNFSTLYESGHLGSLIQGEDGFLYGGTLGAGSANPGSIFKASLDGTFFMTLHNFTNYGEGVVWGSLVQVPDGTLYGTTIGNGTNTSPNGYGTIFKINDDGSGYAVVHHFDGSNGSLPKGDLAFHDNKLYGFTSVGGQYNSGVIFNYDLATSSYHKLVDLDDATGTKPENGRPLFIHAPSDETNYVVKPANNSTGVPLTLNVTAFEVPGAETYTIELNTDPSFGESTAIVKSGGKTISFSGLSMGTIYYSRVQTDITPNWGPTRKFTTGDAVSLAYVISPSNNQTNVSWEPLIKVNPIEGAGTYTIQLSSNMWFNEPLIDEVTSDTTVFSFTGLEQNTTYYTRVSTDLNPNSWGPSRAFTTGNAISLTYVSNPRDQATGVHVTKAIIANPVPGAAQYTIQLSEHADFSTIDFEETGSDNTLSFSGLKYNTTYYNRVRTDLTTEFGAVRSFTTLSPEDLAYVTSPANNSTNIKVNKLNTVSKEVPGASLYTIQLSESSDFSTIAFEATGPTRALMFNGLSYNTTYYTRVLTDLTSTYGEVRSFTTTTAPAAASAREATDELYAEDQKLKINVYPNPFQEKFNLYIESAEHNEAKIILMDMIGQPVHESVQKTNSSIEVAKPLPTGAYFLQVNVGGAIRVVKMIKVQ